MLHVSLSNLVHILHGCIFPLSSTSLLRLGMMLLCCHSSSHSASLATLPDDFELMSNNTYRNFVLREYFIDLLNISHSSLVRSMLYTHHLPSRSRRSKSTARSPFADRAFTFFRRHTKSILDRRTIVESNLHIAIQSVCQDRRSSSIDIRMVSSRGIVNLD